MVVAYVAGILVTLVILASGMFFLEQVFWPVKTFRFDAIVTSKLAYSPGDVITYSTRGCKFTDLPAEVDLQFEGVGPGPTYEYPVPSFTADVRAGCGIGVNNVQLPFRAHPGVYVLRDTLSTNVNRFHTEVVTGVSNRFLVTGQGET